LLHSTSTVLSELSGVTEYAERVTETGYCRLRVLSQPQAPLRCGPIWCAELGKHRNWQNLQVPKQDKILKPGRAFRLLRQHILRPAVERGHDVQRAWHPTTKAIVRQNTNGYSHQDQCISHSFTELQGCANLIGGMDMVPFSTWMDRLSALQYTSNSRESACSRRLQMAKIQQLFHAPRREQGAHQSSFPVCPHLFSSNRRDLVTSVVFLSVSSKHEITAALEYSTASRHAWLTEKSTRNAPSRSLNIPNDRVVIVQPSLYLNFWFANTGDEKQSWHWTSIVFSIGQR
jgi:hypothetical protein